MTTDTETYPPTPPVKWGRLIAIIAIVVGIPAGIIACNEHYRPYRDWQARGHAWLERCDASVPPEHRRPADICARELTELLDEGRLNGWTGPK